MWFPILVKWCLYIESGPRYICQLKHYTAYWKVNNDVLESSVWIYNIMGRFPNIRHRHVDGLGHGCGCLVTWFCYQLIAKPGDKTATPPRPHPNIVNQIIINHTSIEFQSSDTDRAQCIISAAHSHFVYAYQLNINCPHAKLYARIAYWGNWNPPSIFTKRTLINELISPGLGINTVTAHPVSTIGDTRGPWDGQSTDNNWGTILLDVLIYL